VDGELRLVCVRLRELDADDVKEAVGEVVKETLLVRRLEPEVSGELEYEEVIELD
jgi:hypothetical protein